MEGFYPLSEDQIDNGFPAGEDNDNVFYISSEDQNDNGFICYLRISIILRIKMIMVLSFFLRFSILLMIRMIMVSQQGMGRRDNKWVSWQMEKICMNCKVYLYKLEIIFVWIGKYICLNWKSYLSGLVNIFVSAGNHICKKKRVSWQMEKRGRRQPASHSHFQMYLY